MNPVERGVNRDGVYAGDYHSIYNLCTNQESRLPEGLMEFTAFAIFLVKVKCHNVILVEHTCASRLICIVFCWSVCPSVTGPKFSRQKVTRQKFIYG